MFLPLLPELTERHHVFAPDLRGHGRSGRIADSYRGENYCADIEAFLRQRVKEPVILFGHSLGGMIALYLAAKQPELVRALVLAETPISMNNLHDSHYPALFRGVLGLLESGTTFEHVVRTLGEVRLQMAGHQVRIADLPGNDAAFLRFWARALSMVDADTIRMTVDGRSSERWPGRALLTQVKCPTLLMQGNPDLGGLMSDEDVKNAVSAIRDTTYVRLSGVGHSLYIQETGPTLRTLMNFLGSL